MDQGKSLSHKGARRRTGGSLSSFGKNQPALRDLGAPSNAISGVATGQLLRLLGVGVDQVDLGLKPIQ
jgi:hypothetical protein